MNFIFPTSGHTHLRRFRRAQGARIGRIPVSTSRSAPARSSWPPRPESSCSRIPTRAVPPADAIGIDFDNGFGCDLLHLSRLDIGNGQRVAQGDRVGLSGASANGSDTGVGAHLHISLRNRHGSHLTGAGNVDFMQRVSGSESPD